MENRTLGDTIAALRKEQGMTQLELAGKLGVTDKAVSKWERNLACPDVHSLPKLASVLGVSVDVLMQWEDFEAEQPEAEKNDEKWIRLKLLVLRAVALAMGIAMVVLSYLKQLDVHSGLAMAGVAVTALGIHAFLTENDRK